MIETSTLALMERLTQAHGISGDEKAVSRILKREYEGYCDELVYDQLGSIFAIKRSKNPQAKTLMLAGHMDEVGFIVNTITEGGLLGLAPIGGWWSQTLLGHRVIVKAKDDSLIKGTIASIPPHLLTDAERKAPMEIKNMRVDIGATDKAGVLALGIQLGSPVVLDGPFEVLSGGARLLSKAWDNRYGCILGVELLHALKDVDLDVHLAVGATVQEEVGTRGAQTATHVIKPDAAIVFDCSPANDTSGDKEAFGQLGKGPLIRFIDANYLPHRGFINYYTDVLDAANLPYQYYQSLGGTDAGAIHKSFDGVMTLTACICARNIHTNSSIIDTQDYENAKKAMLTLIPALTSKTIADLQIVIQ
jgi:glutamyl aminopeptidase